jgi:putative chitinase
MDNQDLLKIFPYAAKSPLGLEAVTSELNNIFIKLGNQVNRCAAFLAQTGVESNSFLDFSENLNYSAQGLLATFPKYFDQTTAQSYAHQRERIANHVYANRMGNGNEDSGDGYFYRGRGAIACTGRYNYDLCGKALGIDAIGNPDLLSLMPGALDSALWFWTKMNLNKYSDRDDIKTITKLINGGYNGLNERTTAYELAKTIL